MAGLNYYYAWVGGLSFLLSLLFLYKWNRHFDVHLTLVFVLIPMCTLSFYMMYTTPDPSAAMVALKIIYVGACFLPWVITMCVASLCGIRVNRPLRMASFLLSAAVFGLVLTVGRAPYFYKSLSLEKVGATWILHKEYGPAHGLYYLTVALYLLADLGLLIYTYRKKKQVSRRMLLLLFLPIPISVAGYVVNHFTMRQGLEVVPLAYLLAQVVYLFIVQRMSVYNVSGMAVESLVESGETGFITVDFKLRYLGSNKTAREILPDLNTLSVDGPVRDTDSLKESVLAWIGSFRVDQEAAKRIYYRRTAERAADEKIYAVTVNYLSDGRKRWGYQIFLEDDTQNQRYIRLMDQYNSELQKDVDAKTRRILAMQDKLVLGMATMVESRDNSTGGHIRRPGECGRILLEELRKEPGLGLTEAFCENLIKAAPMHDLGKIAVDDAVLRKNGPVTPEEQEILRRHPAEGARIVRDILQGIDDEDFRRIVENVAHYHHERMDGGGYPEGLRGEEIPLEARIMAIADVYDALVSKRPYKEGFSFAKTNELILAGMGSHFDPALRAGYERARPKLEAFYASEQAAAAQRDQPARSVSL